MLQQIATGMKEELESRGFSVAPNLPCDALLPLAEQLGRPTPDKRDPAIVRDLLPRPAFTSTPNTLSSRYGEGPFPFHSETAYWDLPARIVLLYCVDPGSGNRPTLLLDLLSNIRADQRDALARDLWVVRYTRRPFLTKVLSSVGKRLLVRYDKDCMRPIQDGCASEELMTTLCARERAQAVSWQPGLLLAIDNFRLLHGRGEADSPDPGRHLRRVLLREER